MMWGGGLYGRPPSPMVSCGPAGSPTSNGTGDHKGLHTIPRMASPTYPNHSRPYGILGWRLRSMPIALSKFI
jgi:hypothetical protein